MVALTDTPPQSLAETLPSMAETLAQILRPSGRNAADVAAVLDAARQLGLRWSRVSGTVDRLACAG